jgi:MoaA/NifB/PqqE/SkfB family radical SAM enzyme
MGNLADFIELRHWDLDKILPNLQVEKMPRLKRVHIEGDNGDAMMHPRIIEILDFFAAAPTRPVITMLTNGGMRQPRWWKKLGERFKDILQIQFSIDGLHDTNPLYRVDINHSRVLENVKAFIQGGGEATTRCIVFKHNQHQLAQIEHQARDVGFSALIFIPNDAGRFQGQDKWAVYDRQFNITHHIENTSIPALHQLGYSNTKLKIPSPARVPGQLCPEWQNGTLSITYKGHIIPCCMYHADLYFDHASNKPFRDMVGAVDNFDLNLKSLSEILQSDSFYGTKLTESLRFGPSLDRCLIRCPTVAKGKKIVPIIQL